MTLYLKLFAATGIPFGIIMGVIHNPFTGLWAGGMFGAIMALVLGSLQHMTGGDRGTPKVRQESVLLFDAEKNLLFSRCLDALGSLHKCKVTEEDGQAFRIMAETGTTWKSFGETITIVVREDGPVKAQAIIKSEPKVKTTLVDYGKNRENVDKITAYLERYLIRADIH